MKVLYDNNPLYELYSSLSESLISYFKNLSGYKKEMDNVLQLILKNNKCEFRDTVYSKEVYIMNGNYLLYFISGAVGNKNNDFFDYVELNGLKILVIFVDFFKNIFSDNSHNNSISKALGEVMGRSMYFNIIKNIVYIFNSTSSTTNTETKLLYETSIAKINMLAPDIIGARVLYDITNELNEIDIEGSLIEYKDLMDNIINGNIKLVLYGIFTM